MARCFLKTGQLQAGIELGTLTMIAGKGALVCRVEIGDDRSAIVCTVDTDEAPGLGVADGGREAGEVQQLLDQHVGNGTGAETAHVAAPAPELAQVVAETVVELRR